MHYIYIKKIIAVILAGVLIATIIPTNTIAQNEPTKNNKEHESNTMASETSTSQADLIDYYTYKKQNSKLPQADTEISLTAKNANLSATNAELQTEYEGEPNVAILQRGGSLEWNFDAPKSTLYSINVRYIALPGQGRDLKIGFKLDDKQPFIGSEDVVLTRTWRDKGEMDRDRQGNDLIPLQEEVFTYRNAELADHSSFFSGVYQLYLQAGQHQFQLYNADEALGISAVTMKGEKELPHYSELKAKYDSLGYKIVEKTSIEQQAETTYQKSNSILYPVYDRTDAATVPNEAGCVRRNIIGGANWSDSGMWISYELNNIPEDGLYELTVKYRQNTQLGMSTFRNIYVNGEIPCLEFENVAFPFNFNWENKTLTDKDGSPCYVYLHKGRNVITFEATVGKWSSIFHDVNALNTEMNDLYRRIIIVTSTSPDSYRDYQLDIEIAGLQEKMADLSNRLSALAYEIDAINGTKSTQSEPLRRASEQMSSFSKNPDTIPSRLSNFQDTIGNISTWLLSNVKQPLEIDYFMIHSEDKKLPAAKAGFFQNIAFSFMQFIATFSNDYNSINDWNSGSAITVWSTEGRDQVQILKDMITNDFTTKTDIHVNLNLVQTGYIEATLAGLAPDVCIGMARGQPVNLACRNALTDLSQFDTFGDVVKRFGNVATLPYQYQGKTFGLPLSQTFFMMFYRTDIFEELGLTVPQTWDEMDDIVSVLQRKNMTLGIPYASITAQGAVDTGVGARDMFPLLLMQYGGSYYNKDLTKTELDTKEALNAFKKWTSYYTKSGLSLTYDFNTRFRTGEMPIAIQNIAMYSLLKAAAPEIRNQWTMVPIPGVNREDGSIDRTTGASGTSAVIFKKAADKEACWKFIDWLTTTDTQLKFSNAVENLLGSAARCQPANIDAYNQLPWSDAELNSIKTQRSFIREIEEVPGSYYVSRCIDNAFRDVLYNKKNPRTVLETNNENINREINRKRTELSTHR